MICPNCKNEIGDGFVYCPHCGMKIERCPICHEVVIEGAKYCSHCGHELGTESEQTNAYDESADNAYSFTENENQNIYNTESIQKEAPFNKKKIILITVIVFILISISYRYIYHGPQISEVENTLEQEHYDMEIHGKSDMATLVGNVNQGGQVFQDDQYVYICDDENKLVRMDKKLENRKVLIDESCEYVQVVDQMIYYANANHYLFSMTIDGKNNEVLVSQAVYYVVYKDGCLYYQLDDQGKEYIYVYDLHSKKSTQLNKRASYCLNVLDDCIYYTGKDGIYKIGLDGKGDEKIVDGQISNLIYHDQCLYYSHKDALTRYVIHDNKTEVLIHEPCLLLNMNGQTLLYMASGMEVKAYELKTKESHSVYGGPVDSVYILGDKIVLQTSKGYKVEGYKIISDFSGNHQQRLFQSKQGDFV